MPNRLQPGDRLSRFIFSRSDFNPSTGLVKTSVFTGKHPNGYSVFNTLGMCEGRVWHLGVKKVERDKPIIARCDTAAQHYMACEVTIDRTVPKPRHHDVHGLPIGAGMEEARKLSLRQMMVDKSIVVVRP